MKCKKCGSKAYEMESFVDGVWYLKSACGNVKCMNTELIERNFAIVTYPNLK